VSSTRGRAWRLALIVAGIVVAVDQIIKAIVDNNLVLGQDETLIGPVNVTLVHNEGVAFGLAGGGGVPVFLLGLVALGLMVGVFAYAADRPGVWLAMGLLVGGALGNLADRVRIEAVIDYIDFPAWPAFNLADIAITVGVGLLAFSLIREPEAT
jgi:signal peptidase II